jgi:hypothetical protein
MRTIDTDLKKVQDELNEVKNHYASIVKKEGSNFQTKDISETIYTSQVDASIFPEKAGSEHLATLVVIVHK